MSAISLGKYPVRVGTGFSDFVSSIRESNVHNVRLCFVLLHLYKTEDHRVKLLQAWQTQCDNGAPDVTSSRLLSIYLGDKLLLLFWYGIHITSGRS